MRSTSEGNLPQDNGDTLSVDQSNGVEYELKPLTPSTEYQNTIATDGKGGIKVRLKNTDGMHRSVKRAFRLHEEEHIRQFYDNASPESLALVKNATEADLLIVPKNFNDLARFEVEAYTVEIDYYARMLGSRRLDDFARQNIMANDLQARGIRSQFRRALQD